MIDCITSRFEQHRTQEIERENYLHIHSIKIIEILAEANRNIILGKSITENFADFYKEFVILNIMNGWTVSRAFENNSNEEINDNTDDEEFDYTEEPELQEETRFFEIMEKDPKSITEKEQTEVFKLFPTLAYSYLDVMV